MDGSFLEMNAEETQAEVGLVYCKFRKFDCKLIFPKRMHIINKRTCMLMR